MYFDSLGYFEKHRHFHVKTAEATSWATLD